MIETERKFLINNTILPLLKNGILYVQGYLNTNPERTLRVRIAGEKAFITIKGKTNKCSRLEFEYEIPRKDAEELIPLCENIPVKKIRHIIHHDSHCWEIDVFLDENKGLLLAEIELNSEDEKFTIPSWIEKEVTNDVRYFNSYLSQHPYTTWDKK